MFLFIYLMYMHSFGHENINNVEKALWGKKEGIVKATIHDLGRNNSVSSSINISVERTYEKKLISKCRTKRIFVFKKKAV